MKDADGEEMDPTDFFAILGEESADEERTPAQLCNELVLECPEFSDHLLGRPKILWVMRFGSKVKGGKTVLGEMAECRFMGGLAPLATWLLAKRLGGDMPDFICTLDELWWRGATPLQRKALVHHELKHIGIKLDAEGEKKFNDDGDPVWELKAHDLEEFRDTVRRFGDFAGDVASFVQAARDGGVA